MIIAKCKANGMTVVKLAKESGKMNEAGMTMLNELNKWLGSSTCQFAMNGFQGNAPVEFDASMLHDLWKAFKEGK